MTLQQDLRAIANWLLARQTMLVTAESCTGGMLAAAITDLPGSSSWFNRGWVTYTNAAKSEMLGVSPSLIERHGAVSEPVVKAMARGACERCHASVAIAVSGIAGPDGGSPDKPVGTVWLGWALPDRIVSECCHFEGDRAAVREATVSHAFGRLRALLE